MDDISVMFMDMPPTVKGMVVKTFDCGEDYYTIVLNSALSRDDQEEAFWHEIEHIKGDDFNRDCTSSYLEYLRHKETPLRQQERIYIAP